MKSSNDLSNENIELNKEQSKYFFENLNRKYILQKLFDNLYKKKTFKIIKYNNKIKERLEININDYKEYSEKYSSIEIEITPSNNKRGKFINLHKGEEIYYHIYFNNNINEEIKRNYL